MQSFDRLAGLGPNFIFNSECADDDAIAQDIEDSLSILCPGTDCLVEIGWNGSPRVRKQSRSTNRNALSVHRSACAKPRQRRKPSRLAGFCAIPARAAHNRFRDRVFGVRLHRRSKAQHFLFVHTRSDRDSRKNRCTARERSSLIEDHDM